MQKADGMTWPFAQEDMADNLIEWAGKIKAIGEVWGALAWHVRHYDGDDDALLGCGETLGCIIGDYAGMIEDTITENFDVFHDLDKKTVLPLARCREVYDFVKNTKRPEDIIAIDFRLNELTDFIKDVAIPAIGLKDDLLALRKSLATKQKSAPAAETAAAGA